MSPLGHYISGLGLGIAGAAIIGGGYYWEQGHFLLLTDTIHWLGYAFSQGSTDVTPYAAIALCFLIGSVLGSRAPDLLEQPLFLFIRHIRTIGYRAVAHTPWFWLLITVPIVWILFLPIAKDPVYLVFAWLGVGFVTSAWLHLLIDFFGHGGIPLIKPRGRRVGFPVYENTTLAELIVLIPILLMQAALAWFIHHPYQF
jgi:membrane-bound metal-dependent hydrolase YbcI (DUF457 family)